MIATSADHNRAFEIIHDVQLVDLTYRDAQFVRAELADAIANAISAAVADAVLAERNKCIEIAIDGLFDLTGTYQMTPPEIIRHTRRGIAAAIRARGK